MTVLKRLPFWGTLRFRFALWISLFLLLLLIAFSVFVYRSLENSLANALDDALRANAAQLAQFVEVAEGAPRLRSVPEGQIQGDRSMTVRLLDRHGEIIFATGTYRNIEQPADLRQRIQDRALYSTVIDPFDDDDFVRLYTLPLTDNGAVVGFVESAQSLDGVTDPLETLLILLQIGVPGFVLIVGVGGYWLAGRALAPIDRITETARRITAEDLATRLNLSQTNDEVGRLAATLDMMLSRLEGAFRREKEFTSDASHELRTPLAAIRTILDTTRANPRSTADYEEALDDIGTEALQLQNLIENLLTLAREETHRPQHSQRIDLSRLLDDMTDTARPLAAAKGLRLQNSIDAGLTVTGDADLLMRLFFNLVDNAIKYAHTGTVSIKAARRSVTTIEISVTDTGCGIPADHLPRIFDRFYRVESARSTPGTGLGLTIAGRIAANHDGTITAHSVENQGTTIMVTLPSDAHKS